MTTNQIVLAHIVRLYNDDAYIKTILDSPKYYSVLSMPAEINSYSNIYYYT